MTGEMIEAAYTLMAAAEKYRELYQKENGVQPVVCLCDNRTGEGVFIADSFNYQLIKEQLDGINKCN